MHRPSEMQLKAIMHGNGPARVLAGPGSGKTTVIIQRIYYLITHHQISPNQILCVTFTKAAAHEMEQRFYHSFPDITNDIENKVQFGTLHSLCFHILKQSGQFQKFSLVSEYTKQNIIKQILATEGISQEADYDMVEEILSAIGKKKNVSDNEFPLCLEKEQFQRVFSRYEEMLQERNLLDFDDMICQSLDLLKKNKTERLKWQTKFSYLLVDEFQDVNEKQYELIKIIAKPQENLFIVGDDDQSIYGFRGAMPQIMKALEVDYNNLHKLTLTENYRSGNKIVALATEMIKENETRLKKKPLPMKQGGKIKVFFSQNRWEEENRILEVVKKMEKQELHDTAIIVRTNREVFLYRSLLKKNNIPISGKKEEKDDMMHHFIMEDICAFLKFIYEGNKRADFLKFINKPERYFSRHAVTGDIVSKQMLYRYYGENAQMRRMIEELFEKIEKARKLSPALAIRYFRQVLLYDTYLEGKEISSAEKEKCVMYADKIQRLFTMMHQNETVDLFLKRITSQNSHIPLVKKEETPTLEGISVLTMHSAKGLEFTNVFLPDLNEGVIPERSCRKKDEIEEERRLLYVAITRAKENLYLLYTKERNRKPTRFLNKILTGKNRNQ